MISDPSVSIARARCPSGGKTVNLKFLARRFSFSLVGASILAVYSGVTTAADDIQLPITAPAGEFPIPREFRATYRLGWSGFIAARATIFLYRHGNEIRLDGGGKTVGVVRALWRLDAVLKSQVASATLRSRESVLEEVYAGHSSRIVHRFWRGRVEYERTEHKSGRPAKRDSKTLRHPDALDLFGALLRLRSQTLADGDTAQVVEAQGNTLYLASVRVRGRETIRAAGRLWPAIRADLDLKKILKDGSLAPHKKFRNGTVWISDDADRHLLRIESRVFIGSVYAELESLGKP